MAPAPVAKSLLLIFVLLYTKKMIGFYFLSGEVGQKQNGTGFPLSTDGEMSARLNGHFLHDDVRKGGG